VSALIHAATMVTAGVYMVARSSAPLPPAPDTMMVVAVIERSPRSSRHDRHLPDRHQRPGIHRLAAGYMFLACGVGAFTRGSST